MSIPTNKVFWNELTNYCTTITLPIMVIGDLNEISSMEDKLGGIPPILDRFKIIQNFNNTVGTMNIQFTANRVTWRKLKGGPNNIMERPDRVFVSNSWLNYFPSTITKHLEFSISDHYPIILHTNTNNSNDSKFLFRYENSWSNTKEYESIVRKSWRSRTDGFMMFQLTKKLKNLIKTLFYQMSKQ